MADQSALNNKLKANTKLKSFKDDITSAVGDVADIQKVNDVTVLGQEVGEAVNNVKSLDNNKDKLTQNIKEVVQDKLHKYSQAQVEYKTRCRSI